MQPVNPHIYPGKYKNTRKPYWLVKCQVPDPTNPFRKESYQKKHPTEAEAEGDRIRLIRTQGGGSLTAAEFKLFELAQHRIDNCSGDARGKTVLEAVDFFIANFKDQSHAPFVEECVALFRQEHLERLRAESRDEYDRYLTRLVGRFGRLRIVELTTSVLTQYLQNDTSPRHHRKCLLGFFSFCSGGSRKIKSRHKWLENNPAIWIPVPGEVPENEIIIYTIDEVKRALAQANLLGDLPYWIWCLFTGMRPCETKKFWTREGYGWNRVNLDGGYIVVNKEIAKDKRRRKILIRPNLLEWLKYFRATGEPMYPTGHRLKFREVKRVAVAKVKYSIKDVLRHTYISNRVQWFDKSMATTAVESGNSETIIKSHYLDLISGEESIREFWSLTPASFGLSRCEVNAVGSVQSSPD